MNADGSRNAGRIWPADSSTSVVTRATHGSPTFGSAAVMFALVPDDRPEKRAVPRMAMPSAEPTWRIVELAPDARPERCGGTSERTMDVSCAVAKPTPTP